MSEQAPARMDADTFMAWAATRPEGERHELHDGVVVAMAPQRAAHVDAKFAVTLRLREAIAAAGLDCRAYIDGLSVRVDAWRVFEPDALVRCGERLRDDAVEIDDPVIVVEIVSPSSAKRDSSLKLAQYFRLASVHHYLVVLTDSRTILHHARQPNGAILTRIVTSFPLILDPPGLSVADVFAVA